MKGLVAMRRRSRLGLCGLGGLLVAFAVPSTAQAVSASHWVPRRV